MTQLNFINSIPTLKDNPVLEGYDKAQTREYQQKTRDLGLQRTQQEIDTAKQAYDFRNQENPYTLREKAAQAGGAESKTRVETATEQSRINEAGAESRSKQTAADKAAYDFGEEQANQANSRRTNTAKADQAVAEGKIKGAEAQVKQGTVLSDINAAGLKNQQTQAQTAQTQAQTAQTRATTANTADLRSYEYYTKAMEALAKGDVDIAQAYAAKAGKELPPELIANRELAVSLDKINKEAARRYPNRPADAQEWSRKAHDAMTNALGQFHFDPQKMLNVEGAPAAPEAALGLGRPGAVSTNQPNLTGVAPQEAALVRFLISQHQMPNPNTDDILHPAVPDKDEIVRILQSQGKADLARRIYGTAIPGRIPFLQLNPSGPVTQPRPTAAPAQTPQAGPTASMTRTQQPQQSSLPPGITPDVAVSQARAAIAAGKNPQLIKQRLQSWGIDTSGL